MGAAAIAPEPTATYLLDVPVHRLGADLQEAFDAASPRTWPAALVLQAQWYAEAAASLRSLAAVSRDVTIVATDNSVRVTGPRRLLDGFEFLSLEGDDGD